ncbi:MAG: MaoC family dehydratase N-terminal domain-containing protein [Actinobacteria bacterium]|nr:MaoC family dehydratase N-terminal domain-containing protein [Actinomycetota bacterium]
MAAPESAVDLSVGHSFETARRTITEADIVNFAGLSNDFNPLHVDEPFAAATAFGRRIAHGQMIAAIVTGLRSELDRWPVLAYVGASRDFRGPIGAGDTIHAVYTISGSRPTSSDPERGVVTLDLKVLDQAGNEAMTGEDVMLVDLRRQG